MSTSGRGYYHICSDGNRASVLFPDTRDFKAAMNRIAVLSLRMDVVILAFVLMDNHFHFIVKAPSGDDAEMFANEFKRLTGIYEAHERDVSKSISRLPVKVLDILDADSLKTQICYTAKNPTKARMSMFYDYPWGTGPLYFQKSKFPSAAKRVDSFTQEQIRKICKTRIDIPGDWLIHDGILLPVNYIPVDEVEQLFRSTRSYMYFLSLNKDDEIEHDMGDWNELRLTDIELRQERDRHARERFGKHRLRDMSIPERLKIARFLKNKYLCSRKQLARIVQLPLEIIEKNL